LPQRPPITTAVHDEKVDPNFALVSSVRTTVKLKLAYLIIRF